MLGSMVSTPPHTVKGVDWRAVMPCSKERQRTAEKRDNCGEDRGRAGMDGGMVASLIDKTHSGRQAVKAKQPWQLIGSSSCQVSLGNRLKPQSGYLFYFLMHVPEHQNIFGNTPTHDESLPRERIKVSCESKLLFSPFSGTGRKTRPQRTERPYGRHSHCSPTWHPR